TDWGKELGSLWQDQAKQHGYQVVSSGEYAPGAKDFSDLILKAKSAGAEALFALPSPPDGMTIFKQMKELDFNVKASVFFRALDRDKIRDAIAATNTTTVVGPVRFRSDGTGEVKVYFQQWLKGKQ